MALGPTKSPLDLWPHQREAVNTVRRYLAAFDAGRTEGACLIHMPTGSGKTGVIATLARCLPGLGETVILSPRRALCRQLAREVGTGFYAKLPRSPAELLTSVFSLLDHRPSEFARTSLGDLTLVATVQKLHRMARRGDSLYRRLQRELGLLVFDEGHYEPAPEWRETVRALGRPRVIFTATPFRNDFKLFDVDLGYCYTYYQAQRDGFVRAVQIEPAETPSTPAGFVRMVVETYARIFPGADDPGTEPRAIIRCDDKEGIRQIGTALASYRPPQTFVAVHDTFAGQPRAHPAATGAHQAEHQSVPDPDKTVGRFWIHQYKLLEGVDDPRFQLLAIYDRFSSVRELVQQIGRVVRNPGKRRGAVAHVIDSFDGALREMWQNYLHYDRIVHDRGLGALDLNTPLLTALRNAHPSMFTSTASSGARPRWKRCRSSILRSRGRPTSI